MSTVFLLSPARCDGRRAQQLLAPHAAFDLALRIRTSAGAPIGEVFSFLSGLYFRGKLAYALAFGSGSAGAPASFVITTDRGLLTPDAPVTRDDLLAFATVDIAIAGERFTAPLARDIDRLASTSHTDARFVLLGSIASSKYVDTLTRLLGERLVFPSEFIGRGDMSRGGLLLRQVAERRELTYVPVLGSVRHGTRPPRLAPIRRTR